MSNPQHNDGGPAFPALRENNNPTMPLIMASAGMSLRDWFAGKCDPSIYNPLDTLTHKLARKPTALELAAYIAVLRLIEADAMLKALEEKSGTPRSFTLHTSYLTIASSRRTSKNQPL